MSWRIVPGLLLSQQPQQKVCLQDSVKSETGFPFYTVIRLLTRYIFLKLILVFDQIFLIPDPKIAVNFEVQ